jgi:hypothetical protein
MGRRGPEPDHAKREEFARLIREGVPSRRASRLVGIHPRTGKRWRNGRRIVSVGQVVDLPPVITTVALVDEGDDGRPVGGGPHPVALPESGPEPVDYLRGALVNQGHVRQRRPTPVLGDVAESTRNRSPAERQADHPFHGFRSADRKTVARLT